MQGYVGIPQHSIVRTSPTDNCKGISLLVNLGLLIKIAYIYINIIQSVFIISLNFCKNEIDLNL